MSRKGRVLVAMSGGVDSSVAAVMLREQGYEVIGITMKTWDYAQSGGNSDKETGCCTLESMNDARQVSMRFGFNHFIVDIRDEFGDWVIDRFVDEYMQGRTPNPCVLCNTHIKWAALLKRADKLNCDFIATGHYANVREQDGQYVISRGKDAHKDQSYALWGVDQKHLARTRFPLGSYHKSEIRRFAEEFELFNVANKKDSYEICFVPDNDYRRFLRDRVDGLEEKVDGGLFVDRRGNVLGKHKGYPFYTIGQRRGLHLALGKPVYVTHIDPETNTITVGEESELVNTTAVVRNVVMGKYDRITEEEMPVNAAIRYNDRGEPGFLTQNGEDEITVRFPEGRSAITPGQALVAYEGDDVLAGGWIHKATEPVFNDIIESQ
ncbi:tRNA 2-thiouridine(34) synthase MnmA [Natronogracilivirga saccharolytica]|uniref:tRNA-specific 2-thiouridylase MnmA n=1 Tax=Natronogracilivirga saccharolytica TaxID=2812953 RepID=A0A8J7SAW8_9BACT|nr:tRNA 2-thiouridine(34) synthase MnmA [Natronogracilivirga saccharolytica]MBP3193136.1 tRNA 2-thiouridine(34) synthase MnmA [Natronogracilivirga saccharolytica]